MTAFPPPHPEPTPPHRTWIVLAAVLLWGCNNSDDPEPIDVPGGAARCCTSTRDATDVAPALGAGDLRERLLDRSGAR